MPISQQQGGFSVGVAIGLGVGMGLFLIHIFVGRLTAFQVPDIGIAQFPQDDQGVAARFWLWQ